MRKLLAVIIPLLLLGGVVGVLLFIHKPDNTRHNVGSSPTQATSVDLQTIQTALNSTDLSTQATVMSPDLATAYKAQSHNMLPPGGSIRILQDTLKVDGNAAKVDAIITSNGNDTTYTLLLARQDSSSSWLLLNTEKK